MHCFWGHKKGSVCSTAEKRCVFSLLRPRNTNGVWESQASKKWLVMRKRAAQDVIKERGPSPCLLLIERFKQLNHFLGHVSSFSDTEIHEEMCLYVYIRNWITWEWKGAIPASAGDWVSGWEKREGGRENRCWKGQDCMVLQPWGLLAIAEVWEGWPGVNNSRGTRQSLWPCKETPCWGLAHSSPHRELYS